MRTPERTYIFFLDVRGNEMFQNGHDFLCWIRVKRYI